MKVSFSVVVFRLWQWCCRCVVSQRFLAERQANRDGPCKAGQTGVTERSQRDRRGESPFTSKTKPIEREERSGRKFVAEFDPDNVHRNKSCSLRCSLMTYVPVNIRNLDPRVSHDRWWTGVRPQEVVLKWRSDCGSLWADRTCRRAPSAGWWSISRR